MPQATCSLLPPHYVVSHTTTCQPLFAHVARTQQADRSIASEKGKACSTLYIVNYNSPASTEDLPRSSDGTEPATVLENLLGEFSVCSVHGVRTKRRKFPTKTFQGGGRK